MKVLATLGYFDDSGACALIEIDLARETARTALSFTPPPPLRQAGKGFTGAAWTGLPRQSDLLVCGPSAIYRFHGETLLHTGTLHQPDMNDLHCVCCADDRLYIANTGLDSVDVFSLEGRYLGGFRCEPSWLLAERWAGHTPSREDHARLLFPGWSGLAPTFESANDLGDYYSQGTLAPLHQRKVRDFVHPNHVVTVGSQLLVTRLADRRVVDAAALREVLQAPAPPHDGELDGDRFWITCVDGRLVSYAVESGRVTHREIEQIDVTAASGCYGWCRGLLVTDEHLIVGFTAIRRSPRYAWRSEPFDRTATSVVCLEKRSRRVVARVDLESSERHCKLFDIVRWS